MISTKQNDPTNERLGFEEAIAKGKLYNPLSGKELLEFLIRHIKGMLLAAQPPVAAELIADLLATLRSRVQTHPGLDSEVQAYPKADLKIDIYITGRDLITKAVVDILVTKAPKEEKRGFGIVVEIESAECAWGAPLHLLSDFNLDDIPPDALRILNDMPVPTPVRKAGSGPSGESTIVDEPKPAPEAQKAAVEKQFGKGKMSEPLTSKSKKETK